MILVRCSECGWVGDVLLVLGIAVIVGLEQPHCPNCMNPTVSGPAQALGARESHSGVAAMN